jgi:ketosteroid isomerase-like protein
MMDTEASRQLVLDYFGALRAGDQATLARVLAEDVEWVPPQSAPMEGRPYVGRDDVVEAMHREGSRFFDRETGRAEVGKIVADGDTVVVLLHYACTTQGGREYSNDYVWVFTCADGQIVRMDEHTDTLRFHRIVMEP